MMTRILPALELMTQGMTGIFVVLGLIALLVAYLKKIDNNK